MSESMKRRISIVAGTVIVVLAAIAAGATLTPAVSANSIGPLINSIACNSSSPCLDVQNSGSGRAIVAHAKKNSAVVGGAQTGKACPDPTGAKCLNNPVFMGALFSGLRGDDSSTPPPNQILNWAAGVLGESDNGFGVLGIGLQRAGTIGITFHPSAADGFTRYGAFGGDGSTDGGIFNIGTGGQSLLGIGVRGFTHSGIGTQGDTDNPSASTHFSSTGVFGVDFSSDGGLLNIGVLGFSNGTGVSAVGLAPAAPAGTTQTPALAVTCANGGPAMIANTGEPHGDIMSLDCHGNLVLAGAIATDSTPLVSTKTASGVKVAAFVPRQAQQTIEDVGEAQLVSGQAFVGLDATFASTISKRSNYIVFITPEGLTQGTLCVVQRTSAGFAVRENQAGKSTVAFAYRIVAQPLDGSSQRLPLMNAALHLPVFMGGHARRTPAQMLHWLTNGHAHMPVGRAF